MKICALIYHDVYEQDHNESGFAGAHAASYKLPLPDFERHLDTLSATGTHPGVLDDNGGAGRRVGLTFDDGGASANGVIATALAERGWPAYFFITVDRIGTPGFATEDDLRALDGAGHVVGSHSCSHPPQISALSPDELLDEWSRSRTRLSEILGRDVTVASVPGGFLSRAVSDAAWAAGIETLFTSEPWSSPRSTRGGTMVGRFSVTRGTPLRELAALARGDRSTRWAHYLSWNARKAAKATIGPLYRRYRDRRMKRHYGGTE